LTEQLLIEEEAAICAVLAHLDQSEVLDEHRTVATALANTTAATPVFFGNSLTIRAANSHLLSGAQCQPFVNRGASGIDGLIATSAGIALGSRHRTVALIGDLSFLHDQSSLPLIKKLPLTTVILNNNGGQLFRYLPVARETSVFERYFLTPHNLKDFSPLIQAHGIPYQLVSSVSELRRAVENTVQQAGPLVIEAALGHV